MGTMPAAYPSMMGLPLLDKDSYQFVTSEWVTYAGQALQQAGFLHTEPTGLYDEEFAAAVTAFQAHHGIHEENHVGPYTWAALGIEDTEHAAHEEHAVAVDAVSEDGQWRWDGAQWQSAAVTEHNALPATATPSEFEDTELAACIFQYELAILRQWKAALDSFHVVIKSETQTSAKPDFAGALLKVFGEKVLGKAISEFKAGIVFDALKGVAGFLHHAPDAHRQPRQGTGDPS